MLRNVFVVVVSLFSVVPLFLHAHPTPQMLLYGHASQCIAEIKKSIPSAGGFEEIQSTVFLPDSGMVAYGTVKARITGEIGGYIVHVRSCTLVSKQIYLHDLDNYYRDLDSLFKKY